MELSLARMNGLGNHFAIIDMRSQNLPPSLSAADLAQRIEGIDQLLLLERARAGNDLFMAIYNKDGSEAEMCGNGVRCVAWLALKAMKAHNINIETLGGLVQCRKQGELIEANMGKPSFSWAEIPLSEVRDTLNIRLDEVAINLGLGIAVNIGNPHIVFFPNALAEFDWQKTGRALAQHPLFPQGVNVSFAAVKNDGLEIKVWERGAGATKACGTAACAALIAAVRRFPIMPRTAPVKLPGGVLEISWVKESSEVLMSGRVQFEKAETINV